MAKMMKPEVEAVRFRGGIDVIATSGYPTLTLTGFNDDKKDNGIIDFFDGTKTETGISAVAIGGKISDWYSNRYGKSVSSGVAVNNDNWSGFENLFFADHFSNNVNWADGVFTYDPTYSVTGKEGYIWFVKN